MKTAPVPQVRVLLSDANLGLPSGAPSNLQLVGGVFLFPSKKERPTIPHFLLSASRAACSRSFCSADTVGYFSFNPFSVSTMMSDTHR